MNAYHKYVELELNKVIKNYASMSYLVTHADAIAPAFDALVDFAPTQPDVYIMCDPEIEVIVDTTVRPFRAVIDSSGWRVAQPDRLTVELIAAMEQAGLTEMEFVDDPSDKKRCLVFHNPVGSACPVAVVVVIDVVVE